MNKGSVPYISLYPRSMLKEYRGSDKLLTLTGSTIDDLVINENGASAMLNAPDGKWPIKIAPVHVKYVGEELNGYQEKFDLLVPKWLAGMVHQVAEVILISEKVPEIIPRGQQEH